MPDHVDRLDALVVLTKMPKGTRRVVKERFDACNVLVRFEMSDTLTTEPQHAGK